MKAPICPQMVSVERKVVSSVIQAVLVLVDPAQERYDADIAIYGQWTNSVYQKLVILV